MTDETEDSRSYSLKGKRLGKRGERGEPKGEMRWRGRVFVFFKEILRVSLVKLVRENTETETVCGVGCPWVEDGSPISSVKEFVFIKGGVFGKTTVNSFFMKVLDLMCSRNFSSKSCFLLLYN